MKRFSLFYSRMIIQKDDIHSFIQDGRIYLVISLQKKGKRKNADDRNYTYAIMKIPYTKIPRFIELPEHGGSYYIMFIDDVIKANMQSVFPGYEIVDCFSIKISRDADFSLEDEKPITIEKAIHQIVNRSYLLPTIQRKFTWSSLQICVLFDSIMRDYPINTFMFWEVREQGVNLIVSSLILVWGAVEIAHGFGVSDLIIGLTVVAVGTSLPELASSIIAARKGEHDIALGNILGSNLFNTLAVVGIAGTIHPLAVGPEVFNRDMLVMAALTLSPFVIGYGFRGPGRINRIEGAVLLTCYVGYTAYLISTVFGGQA